MNNLQTLITDYLRYLSIEKDSSSLTVREYKRYLKEFSEWLAINYPDFTIDKLDMPTIRAFRSYLAEKVNRRGGNLAKVTQSHYIICIRSFLKFLLKNDIKTLEPSKIELPKTISRSPKFLDKTQLIKLISVIDINEDYGLRDRTIVELFLSTGLRVNELFKLNRDSINLETKEFVVIGKGRKARLVFLSDTACEWISKYLTTRKDNWKPLFIRYSREINGNGEKMRLSISSIERMIKSYGAYAGIELKMTPHVLRHSFATDLMINGADLRSVQELLGHSNIATTQIYTHVTNDELRNAHKQFHGKRV